MSKVSGPAGGAPMANNRRKRNTRIVKLKDPVEAKRILKRQQTCGMVLSLLIVGTVATLFILATGNRPLAVLISNYMNSNDTWFDTPLNDTDAIGDPYPETSTEPLWTTPLMKTTIKPWYKRPKADDATPSRPVLIYRNFTYEHYRDTWSLDAAWGICKRRNGTLIYIDDANESNKVIDWILNQVSDKLPETDPSRGKYWTAGTSIGYLPLHSNYTWFWRDVPKRKSGYENFCFDYKQDISELFWKFHPNQSTLTLVLDFQPKSNSHHEKGCWRTSLPLDVEDEDEIAITPKDDTLGYPFVCKIPLTKL